VEACLVVGFPALAAIGGSSLTDRDIAVRRRSRNAA
jgi:hypothetical protein